MSKELIDHLRNYRIDNKISQAVMADRLGIGYRTYQTIETTGEVKSAKDLESIRKHTGWTNTKLFADKSKKVTSDESVNVLHEAGSELVPLSMLQAMVENTTNLVNQNSVAINSIAKLVDTNDRTARMLEKRLDLPAPVPQQNPLADQSILKGVLEALIQVGTGKHWRTRSEAEAAVRNLISGTPVNKKLSTQNNGGK